LQTTSSAVKGETLSDTIKCLLCYADALVLRHPQQGSAAIASGACPEKPVLNAGDGVGEHPTQALLDLYTIISELKRGGAAGADGLTVTMLGVWRGHGRQQPWAGTCGLPKASRRSWRSCVQER
jgi:carbamoyl-phosphate synthase/aspartate carbamoyltransferase/dihydroorotase